MTKLISKPKVNSLPSGTTVEKILDLVSVLKKNNKDEGTVKALFNMSESVFSKAKAALRALGIIENNNLEFTKIIGLEIAYSDEEDQKAVMMSIVRNYAPYELILNSLSVSKTNTKTTNIEDIKNLWGKANIGSNDRNRNDGATLFMSIIEFIEFGKYVVGRGTSPTRIEWVDDIIEKIDSLNSEHLIKEREENTSDINKVIEGVVDTVFIEKNHEEITPAILTKSRLQPTISSPNVTINVDMSDWSDEKIKYFFKYVYGIFEEI